MEVQNTRTSVVSLQFNFSVPAFAASDCRSSQCSQCVSCCSSIQYKALHSVRAARAAYLSQSGLLFPASCPLLHSHSVKLIVSTAKGHFFLRSLIYHLDTIAFPVFVILVVRTEINQTEGKGGRDKIVHSGTQVYTLTHQYSPTQSNKLIHAIWGCFQVSYINVILYGGQFKHFNAGICLKKHPLLLHVFDSV